jgi:NAD(P)-dependent dehydrogenase (short-subunit alcohol dehydrogenase family)
MRVLVTGASRGLGLGLVTVFAERGDEVVAVCRQPGEELARLAQEQPAVTVLDGIDVADDGAGGLLRERLAGAPLDVVVCNAGVNLSYASGIDDLDVALLRSEFEVNTFGVVRTVQGVLPSLGEGAKVALVSTWRPGVGAAKKNYGYQMSKVAMNQFQYLLADELAGRGVATLLLSPGPMNTQLLRDVVESGNANLKLDQAGNPVDVARDLIARIDELTAETSGAWRFRTGEDMGAIATSVVYGH